MAQSPPPSRDTVPLNSETLFCMLCKCVCVDDRNVSVYRKFVVQRISIKDRFNFITYRYVFCVGTGMGWVTNNLYLDGWIALQLCRKKKSKSPGLGP
jgi:hypothetical protein